VKTTAFGVLLGMALSLAAHAGDLQAYLGQVRSLQAHFEQTAEGESMEKRQTSVGTLSVQSPNKFRLEYTKPYQQIYVADGHKLWSYDTDLEQVTVKLQKDLLANSPAMVLSNPADLHKVYNVTPLGINNAIEWFKLTPKGSDSGFESVQLGFNKQKLTHFEMRDSFGQTTRLTFTTMHYNTSLSADVFRFKPPDGVDVIDDTQSTE
jgi:outer membrane lipoprotein carrier protein